MEANWHRVGWRLHRTTDCHDRFFFAGGNRKLGHSTKFCFLTFIVSSISTLLFNLNPLLRLDGYYVVSDWLEIPNLRQKADKSLENYLLKIGFGIKVEGERLPAKTNLFFVLYSIAATIYRMFLVFVICFILYSALKPVRLEFLGLLVGAVCAGLGMNNWVKRIRNGSPEKQSATGEFQQDSPCTD